MLRLPTLAERAYAIANISHQVSITEIAPKTATDAKDLFIKLWIFADEYSVARLQNEVMESLVDLLAEPFLLATQDVEYIWSRKSRTIIPLKNLAACTLVAQLEQPNTTVTINKFDTLTHESPGLSAKMYKALRIWMECVVRLRASKNVNIWEEILQTKEVHDALMVNVKKRKLPPVAGVMPAMRPAPKPFAPGEVVDMTMDD